MTWRNTSTADITAQSDADGYNESVTVEDGETVHVDTKAKASASSSVSQFRPTWTIKQKVYRDYDDGMDNLLHFGELNIDWEMYCSPDTNMEPELIVHYSDGSTQRFYGNGYGTTVTWNQSNVNVGLMEFKNDYSGGSGHEQCRVDTTVTINQSKSTSIDSKSVVTEDIHK